MTQLKFNTREQLVEALEARRQWAERYDAKNLAKHKKDESDYFKAFQTACREAAKWDYEAAKQNRFKVELGERRGRWGPPECPRSAARQLDRELEYLAVTRQVRFTVSDDKGQGLFWLLTHNENAPKAEVC